MYLTKLVGNSHWYTVKLTYYLKKDDYIHFNQFCNLAQSYTSFISYFMNTYSKYTIQIYQIKAWSFIHAGVQKECTVATLAVLNDRDEQTHTWSLLVLEFFFLVSMHFQEMNKEHIALCPMKDLHPIQYNCKCVHWL